MHIYTYIPCYAPPYGTRLLVKSKNDLPYELSQMEADVVPYCHIRFSYRLLPQTAIAAVCFGSDSLPRWFGLEGKT